jgi:two-component system OmpR family response regulator
MGKCILVIEEDNELRKILSNALEEEGYLTETASTLKEGKSRLEGTQFDLTAAELFPQEVEEGDVSVNEFLGRLKDSQRRPNLLVVTTTPSPQNILRLKDHGFDDVMSKPFSIEGFLDKIQEILSRP